MREQHGIQGYYQGCRLQKVIDVKSTSDDLDALCVQTKKRSIGSYCSHLG